MDKESEFMRELVESIRHYVAELPPRYWEDNLDPDKEHNEEMISFKFFHAFCEGTLKCHLFPNEKFNDIPDLDALMITLEKYIFMQNAMKEYKDHEQITFSCREFRKEIKKFIKKVHEENGKKTKSRYDKLTDFIKNLCFDDNHIRYEDLENESRNMGFGSLTIKTKRFWELYLDKSVDDVITIVPQTKPYLVILFLGELYYTYFYNMEDSILYPELKAAIKYVHRRRSQKDYHKYHILKMGYKLCADYYINVIDSESVLDDLLLVYLDMDRLFHYVQYEFENNLCMYISYPKQKKKIARCFESEFDQWVVDTLLKEISMVGEQPFLKEVQGSKYKGENYTKNSTDYSRLIKRVNAYLSKDKTGSKNASDILPVMDLGYNGASANYSNAEKTAIRFNILYTLMFDPKRHYKDQNEYYVWFEYWYTYNVFLRVYEACKKESISDEEIYEQICANLDVLIELALSRIENASNIAILFNIVYSTILDEGLLVDINAKKGKRVKSGDDLESSDIIDRFIDLEPGEFYGYVFRKIFLREYTDN